MSFSSDIKKFNNKTEKAASKIVRGAALQIFGLVVKATPVDKGRLRANWHVGINGHEQFSKLNTDKNGSKTVKEISSDVLNSKLGDVIYLTNNLPYASVIEHGDGNRTPHRMVGLSIESWEHAVRMKARNK